MMFKKNNKKKVSTDQETEEGYATGSYRIVIEAIDRSLEKKKEAQSSAQKLTEKITAVMPRKIKIA